MNSSARATPKTWQPRRCGAALRLFLLFATIFAAAAWGQDDPDRSAGSMEQAEDRVSFFSSVVVTPDRPAGDIACLVCTVRVEGPVRGDVAVMFGTVSVGEGQTIDGDAALLFSTLDVGDGAQLNGDLATAFSTVQIAPGAHVRGHRAMLASGLGLAVLVGPVLIVVGLVWLLLWLLRRVFA